MISVEEALNLKKGTKLVFTNSPDDVYTVTKVILALRERGKRGVHVSLKRVGDGLSTHATEHDLRKASVADDDPTLKLTDAQKGRRKR